MESKLAKIFQFLSGCIIIVEIVGEDGLKAAALRSNERLRRMRERSISRRMMDDVNKAFLLPDRPESKRTVTHWIVRVVQVAAFVAAFCAIVYLWPLNPDASLWKKIGVGLIRILGSAVVGGIAGAMGILILILLIRIVVIPFERSYGAVLKMLGRFLEHDRVKKRLLTLSFIFLVIGTTLDLVVDTSGD